MDKSVFMIIVQFKNYNYNAPWQSNIGLGHGTGFCVNIKNKKYILTNEHVVFNNISIYINELPVKVLYTDKLTDIAILDCPKELNAVPLKIGQAKVGDTVYAYGFPHTFNNLNITKGTVNRFVTINHKMSKFIHMQFSATTNPGNSGGPIIHNNKVVGLHRLGSTNTYYCIPFFIIDFHINCFYNKLYPKTFDFSWQNINKLMYMLPQFKDFKENGSKGLLLNGKKYVTHVEGIKIHEKGKIKLIDMLNFLGFTFSESDIDSTYYFNFKYLLGLLYKKTVTFSNEYNGEKVELKLENVCIRFPKPIIHIFGGWVFAPITYSFNTFNQTNYPLGKVKIIEIIENTVNYEFVNQKGILLDINWNDFIKLLNNHKKNTPIIIPTFYNYDIYIDPAESKYTENTVQILFGL